MERSRILAWLLVLALTVPLAATAQPGGPAAPSGAGFTPEQLEQVAAPIALYPDPLRAQVLMASTYPLEVVQAERFVKDNPNLKGDQLNERLKDQTWDDSVKSLVAFPEILALMDGKLDWVQKLGDAFLGQQKELLDAVQRLRARAQAQGKDAPGGAYDYLAHGRLIGGFALVAHPAQYGVSGVMTFIVNQDGVVYQKDLGPNTAAIARAMKQFNPDSTWKKI